MGDGLTPLWAFDIRHCSMLMADGTLKSVYCFRAESDEAAVSELLSTLPTRENSRGILPPLPAKRSWWKRLFGARDGD